MPKKSFNSKNKSMIRLVSEFFFPKLISVKLNLTSFFITVTDYERVSNMSGGKSIEPARGAFIKKTDSNDSLNSSSNQADFLKNPA